MIYVSRQSFPVFFYHNFSPPDNFFKAYIICVCLILANIESGAAAAAAAAAASAAATAAAAASAGSSGSMGGTMPAGSVPPGLPQPGTGIFE